MANTRLAAGSSVRAAWSVYLARCADGTLYCGITPDVAARLAAHDAGRGARYTRGRGPLELLVTRRCHDRGLALRIEHAIKRLSRADKLTLAADPRRLAAIARTARRRQLGDQARVTPRRRPTARTARSDV